MCVSKRGQGYLKEISINHSLTQEPTSSSRTKAGLHTFVSQAANTKPYIEEYLGRGPLNDK